MGYRGEGPGSAQTSVAPPSKPSSRAGQRGRRRLTSRLSAKLKPPTSSDGPSNSANRASSRQPFPALRPPARGQAEKIGQLAEDDQQRRAKGEAEHHRMRDEIDQRPDAQDAEQPLEGAGEKGQQQHGLDVLRAAQRRQGPPN